MQWKKDEKDDFCYIADEKCNLIFQYGQNNLIFQYFNKVLAIIKKEEPENAGIQSHIEEMAYDMRLWNEDCWKPEKEMRKKT